VTKSLLSPRLSRHVLPAHKPHPIDLLCVCLFPPIPQLVQSLPTVESLFQHVSSVIGDPRMTLRVTYHDVLG
jgi:hypothetical protein